MCLPATLKQHPPALSVSVGGRGPCTSVYYRVGLMRCNFFRVRFRRSRALYYYHAVWPVWRLSNYGPTACVLKDTSINQCSCIDSCCFYCFNPHRIDSCFASTQRTLRSKARAFVERLLICALDSAKSSRFRERGGSYF